MKFFKLKSIAIFLGIIAFFTNQCQAQYTVSSSNGYDVNISLTLDSIQIVGGSCAGGWYNYNLHFSYDINFTGTNTPSNLWTLQAYIIADDGTHFIPLPNNGGTSSSISGSNVTRNVGDCQTATPASLGCDSIRIQIQGPGIASQYINLNISALPVELISFDVEKQNDKLLVNWSTASEENNDFFTIQESFNGVDFHDVKLIPGAGHSFEILNYSESIALPNEKLAYYRLKQTDFDGSYSYSDIKVLELNELKNEVVIFPNPCESESFTVEQLNLKGESEINIFGADGKLLQNISTSDKSTQIKALPKGMYYISISSEQSMDRKMIRFVQK